MNAQREMTLTEWCQRLHAGHLVNVELAVLSRDAERYRLLRELDGGAIYALVGDCDGIHPEQLDSAIDAAMKGANA